MRQGDQTEERGTGNDISFHRVLCRARSPFQITTQFLWSALTWLSLLLLCVIPVLILIAAATVYAVTTTTPGALLSLGGSVLLLVLLGAMCVSDFRKWSAARTARLVIYEQGFTFELVRH